MSRKCFYAKPSRKTAYNIYNNIDISNIYKVIRLHKSKDHFRLCYIYSRYRNEDSSIKESRRDIE